MPDSELAVQLRTYEQGLFCLHRKEYTGARELFRRLIDQSSGQLLDQQVGFYLGLAAAHKELGEAPRRSGRSRTPASPPWRSRIPSPGGSSPSTLCALFRIWKREEESRDWREFLHRFDVPKKTLDLFLERSRRMVEKSVELRRVFLL